MKALDTWEIAADKSKVLLSTLDELESDVSTLLLWVWLTFGCTAFVVIGRV